MTSVSSCQKWDIKDEVDDNLDMLLERKIQETPQEIKASLNIVSCKQYRIVNRIDPDIAV